MTKLSVLLELGNSRKEIHEEKDYLVCVIEEELKKVGKNDILAYFSCERGHHSLKQDVYILQCWALKWEIYMDVTDLEQIEDGDHLTVIHKQQEDVASSVSSLAGQTTIFLQGTIAYSIGARKKRGSGKVYRGDSFLTPTGFCRCNIRTSLPSS